MLAELTERDVMRELMAIAHASGRALSGRKVVVCTAGNPQVRTVLDGVAGDVGRENRRPRPCQARSNRGITRGQGYTK